MGGVVDFVSDAVGGVVDAVVDVVNDVPLVGEFADDVLGLDPHGGGIVPYVKGVTTGIATGALTGGLMSWAGMPSMGSMLGSIGSTITDAAGEVFGTVVDSIPSLDGGYVTQIFDDGSNMTFDVATGMPTAGMDATGATFSMIDGQAFYDATGEALAGAPQVPTTTQVFDDGSTLTSDATTGKPISGVDTEGNSFSVNDGVGTYDATGEGLGGTPETNFGGNLANPTDVQNLMNSQGGTTGSSGQGPKLPSGGSGLGGIGNLLGTGAAIAGAGAIANAMSPDDIQLTPTMGQYANYTAPQSQITPLNTGGVNPGELLSAVPQYQQGQQYNWSPKDYVATQQDLPRLTEQSLAQPAPVAQPLPTLQQQPVPTLETTPTPVAEQPTMGGLVDLVNQQPVTTQPDVTAPVAQPAPAEIQLDQTTGQMLPGQLPPWLMLDETGMGVIPNPGYNPGELPVYGTMVESQPSEINVDQPIDLLAGFNLTGGSLPGGVPTEIDPGYNAWEGMPGVYQLQLGYDPDDGTNPLWQPGGRTIPVGGAKAGGQPAIGTPRIDGFKVVPGDMG